MADPRGIHRAAPAIAPGIEGGAGAQRGGRNPVSRLGRLVIAHPRLLIDELLEQASRRESIVRSYVNLLRYLEASGSPSESRLRTLGMEARRDLDLLREALAELGADPVGSLVIEPERSGPPSWSAMGSAVMHALAQVELAECARWNHGAHLAGAAGLSELARMMIAAASRCTQRYLGLRGILQTMPMRIRPMSAT